MEFQKPKRYFKKSGYVNPEKSYHVQLENVRNELGQDMKEMIDEGRYFTIFAPGQSGKTTFFYYFCKQLEKESTYITIQLSFQKLTNYLAEEFYQFVQNKLYFQLLNRLESVNCPHLKVVKDFLKVHQIKNNISFGALFEELNILIKRKKMVIFIDEFDGIPKKETVPFLMALRDLYQDYKESESKALYSVGLVGIRNVANLTLDSKKPSPFNIADHVKLPSFTLKNIKDLYAQYTKETNQPFTDQAIQKVFEETSGQTWLVNRLGNIITKEIKPETIEAVTDEDVNKAVDILIKEKNDHFLNLKEKLIVYKNLFFEIALTKVEYDAYDDEQSWLEQYGLIKNLDDNAVVSNPIYQKLFCSSKEIQQNNIEESKPKPLIFLCYAKEDVKRVEVIYDRLQKANFNPWMDTRNILPGQNWDYEIKQAMKKANFAPTNF